MNKLRRIATWLWRNKERMVLVAMVGFLSWRVREVVSPPAPEQGMLAIPPRATGEVEVPKPGPTPMIMLETSPTRTLVERNPWTLYPPGGLRSSRETTQQSPGIYLQQIVPWRDGTYRARLRTENTSYYASEGDEFENFSVMEIDADAGTCVVLDSRSGRVITLQTP